MSSCPDQKKTQIGPKPDPSRRPRVLRIIARLNTGGPSRHVTLLSCGLQQKGYPHLLVAGQVGKGEGSLQHLAETAGVEMKLLSALGPEISPAKDLLVLIQLIRIIRRFQPDIVHTHTAKAGFLGRLAARLCGVPKIFHTYHGHVLRGYFSRPKQEVYRWLEALAGTFSTKLVTLTEGLAGELADLGVATREKFTIIPLGLDLAPFLQVQPHAELKVQLGLDPKAILIGCVGRLAPVKNLPAMLEAMVSLPPNIHLVLVGDGENKEILKEKASALGLENRVHFYGWCENLPWMYGGLDLLVNCSINEGTPVSLLEAMTAGVPVLASPVGGVPEVLIQAGTGTLFAGTSSKEVLRGLKPLLTGLPQLRPPMKKRVDIVSNFGVDRLIRRVEGLYQNSAPEKLRRKNTQKP